MTIYAIDHVQIAMPPGEEDRARAFYSGVLGLREVPKPASLAGRGGAWFASGNVQIHLGVEQDFRPARKAHPALLVDDLDSVVAQLAATGYAPAASEPVLDGYRRIHLYDPFGNRLELMQRLETPIE